MKIFFSLFALLLLFISCNEAPAYTPKPRAYPKVEYPERAYQQFDKDYCKFSFEYPTYAEIVQDQQYFDGNTKHDCWFDLYMSDFDSRLHCTYYPIESRQDFEKLLVDAFELAGKHNMRADYIDEIPFQYPNGVQGYTFEIEGAAASPYQFFVTDSTQHFLRASLYFNTQARPDSLAPVYDFVKADLKRMLETFAWGE